MLSVIVSSYQQNYFDQFSNSVKETIGKDFEYEIIQMWNPGTMGICEAYNLGAKKAQYDNLLFIHEDVVIETQDWGNILIKYFENKNIGCVGIAGSDYIPNVPFAWWDLHLEKFRNLKQFNKKGELVKTFHENKDQEVTCLDGVFLACTKKVYEKFLFDQNIKGFHGYDINFSTRLANNYKNLVISKIMLKHFSEGNCDKKWFDSLIEYRQTFLKPKFQKIDKKHEAFYFNRFIYYLNQFNYSDKEKRNLIIKYIVPNFIGIKLSIKELFKLL